MPDTAATDGRGAVVVVTELPEWAANNLKFIAFVLGIPVNQLISELLKALGQIQH